MKISLALALLFASHCLYAQTPNKEFDFANYLINKSYYEEASFVLSQLLENNSDLQVQDSSNFLLGQINFTQKNFSEAALHFNKVSIQSSVIPYSVFYGSLSHSFLKDYSSATFGLKKFVSKDSSLNSLKTLELAAIQLLNRDFDEYDSLTLLIDKNHYLVGPSSEELDFHKNKLLKIDRKSGLKAGLLSALIPGAGRMYVEKPGQGFYQLVIATLMGLQTVEGYKKDGIQSARFIVFGALFSSFYIGNIWGSAIGVKIYKNEVRKTVDEAILMDMHIPLRTIFR